MKKTNLLITAALSGIFMFSAFSKKNDEPAPVVTPEPPGKVSVTGTFIVNDAAQAPTFASRNTYPIFGITFTQVIVENANYILKLEFSNGTLENGDYSIKPYNPTSSSNREVEITLYERNSAGGPPFLTSAPYTDIVKVKDGNISFSKFTFNDSLKHTLSGDYTIK